MVTVKFGNWSFGFGAKSLRGRRRPLALVILDGWGYSGSNGNAVFPAKTPNYDRLSKEFPGTLLAASGPRIGLLPETPGNSEIGHRIIGAGRVVETKRTRVSNAIKSGEFFDNNILKGAFARARKRQASVHLVGMISDDGVHSSLETLFSLLRMAKSEGCVNRVFVHGILDGRNGAPQSADTLVELAEIMMAEIGCGKFATLCGQYYAMDRAENWGRTARAFTMLVHSDGERSPNPAMAIRNGYLRGLSDDLIEPVVIEEKPGTAASINDGDLVIYFNHSAGGMKQLVRSLSVRSSESEPATRKPIIDSVCIVEYDEDLKLPIAFKLRGETNVLGKVFADHGVVNCRLSAIEKHAHVTYFFNGGVETKHRGERRVMVPSSKIASLTKKTEMACFQVTKNLLSRLEAGEDDVYIVNLASTDLRSHSDSQKKSVEAVEFVDKCIGEIVKKIQDIDGVALITSDYGNFGDMPGAESKHTNNGDPLNSVPFYLVAKNLNGMKLRENGALEDIAPTILGILGIEKPVEMTGNDLRQTDSHQ